MNRRWPAWPAWLAALALGVHLLAPGLCLAQMLSGALLGGICTTSPDGVAATPLPDPAADRHGLESCDQCVATSVAIADGAPSVGAWPTAQDAPRASPDARPVAASPAWRPPPRGPPHAA